MDKALVFNANKKKGALLFLIAAGFIALGLWVSDGEAIKGWFIVIIASIFIPESLAMLFSNKYFLRLDEEGVEQASWTGSEKISWKAIEDICFDYSLRGHQVIKIIYRDDEGQKKSSTKASQRDLTKALHIGNNYNASLTTILNGLNEYWAMHE